MVAQYVDEEVLVREACKQGLDRADPPIRERLADKMRFLLGGEPPPTRAQLDAYLKANRARLPEGSFDDLAPTLKEQWVAARAQRDIPAEPGPSARRVPHPSPGRGEAVSMPRLASPLVWLLAIGWALAARAHDLGVARVELREKPGGHYELDVTLPPRADFLALRPGLPARCTLEGNPAILKRPGVAVMQFRFTCAGTAPLGPGDMLRLPWKREGAFVAATWGDGSSSARSSAVGRARRNKGSKCRWPNCAGRR